MQKRTLLSFAVMFGLGVAWVLYGYWLFLAAGALWLLMRWRGKPPGAAGEKWRRRAVLLMCVCFFLGALHAAERTAVREARQNALSAADTLTGCGEIVKKEIRQDRIIYHLNGVKLDNRQRSIGSVLLYLDSDNKSQEKEFQIADTVSFAGEPVAFRRAGNEGSYDEASYYGSLGYTGKIYADTVTLEKRAAAPWKEALYQLRCRWQSLYLETLPGEEGGVLSSIALGDKSELLQEVKSLYQASGIAHILAVSGLHVSVVGMFLYRLMRRWGIGFGLGGLISGSLVFLFAQLCGMGVSVLRAAGMWWTGLSFLMRAGVIQPANQMAETAYQAKTAVEAAGTLPPDRLPAGCRYLLLGPEGQTLSTNLTGSRLEAARERRSKAGPFSPYRLRLLEVPQTDGSVYRFQYDYAVHYTDPALDEALPDFQICWLLAGAGTVALIVLFTTRRTGRLLRADAALLAAAAAQIAARDLEGPPFGGAQVREYEQALATMQELRQELAASLAAQWEADRRRDQLLTRLTHQLKTPLAAVLASAELLAEEDLTPAQQEKAQTILRRAGEMQQTAARLRAMTLGARRKAGD